MCRPSMAAIEGLQKLGRTGEVLSSVGDIKIAADIDGRILAEYALMDFDAGNKEKATNFLKRAFENG